MESFLKKLEIRGINRVLFGHDIEVLGNKKAKLEVIISSIIQNYDPEDVIAGVPTVLNIEENDINETLLDKIILLNTKSVIIQVNSRVLTNGTKVDIIRAIKEKGYKLMIVINKEDEVFSLARTLADIIKFDIQGIPEKILKGQITFDCKKLAYNVNSPDDYMLAESANIDYYVGSYIGESDEVELKHNTHSKVNFIEIMAALNSGQYTNELLSNILSRDALMSAQIIRLANSKYYRDQEERNNKVNLIEDAVERIGIDNLKKWLMLLQFSSSNRVPEEELQISYHRARFCRKIIEKSSVKGISTQEAYLVGLFSEIDVLSGNKMSAELYNLNLSKVVEEALIYREGIGGKLLNLIKAYEEADNKKIVKYSEYFSISKNKIFKIYYESVIEASELWNKLTEHGGLV